MNVQDKLQTLNSTVRNTSQRSLRFLRGKKSAQRKKIHVDMLSVETLKANILHKRLRPRWKDNINTEFIKIRRERTE